MSSAARSTVLAMDDDPVFLKVLADTLRAAGYDVTTANDGRECLELVAQKRPDLLILDVNMPGMLGTEVCRKLKKRTQTAGLPILIMTANDAQGQEIACLDLGADDFMSKPFQWDRLLARCRALLRRPGRETAPPRDIELGKFRMDFANKVVWVGAKAYPELTPREFELLYEVASNSPRLFPLEELYRRVWGTEPPSEISLKTVRVHVRRIRVKLGWKRGEWLDFTSGRGYFFKAPA